MGITNKDVRRACQDIALAYGLIGVLRSTHSLLHYDRILIPMSLLDRYDVCNKILKTRRRKETIRPIGVRIIEISEVFLPKTRLTPVNTEEGSMPCLLLASLTSLFTKQFKRLNYDVFDLRLSE